MLNNFIYAQTKDLFLEALNAKNILDEAIVFIEDTKEIWNRGHYFGGSSGSGIDSEIISELQTAIAALQSNKVDKSELADYAKKSELPSLDGYLTKTAADGLYATITQYNTLNQTVGNIQTELSNKLTSSDLADYAKTADVPTKISDLTDDSDFITNTDATAAYAPKSLVTTVSDQATTISTLATKNELSTGLAKKLDNSAASGFVPTTRKVNGKALDTDITITATDPNAATKTEFNNLSTEVAGLKAVGAQKNVQSDWNAIDGDAFIKNKPDLSVYLTKSSATTTYAPISLVDKVTANETAITTKFTTPSTKTLAGFGITDGINTVSSSGTGTFITSVAVDSTDKHKLNITKGNVDLSGYATTGTVNSLNTSLSSLTGTVNTLKDTTVPNISNRVATIETYFATDDSDTSINKWNEIVSFLKNVKEGDDVGTLLAAKANQSSLDDTNTNLSGLTAKVNGNSVTKSGETLTVTINGTSQSLTNTNTWRSISDAVNSTSSDVSASSKAVKTAYDLANTANTAAANAQTTADAKWTYNASTIAAVKVNNARYADSAGTAKDQTARDAAAAAQSTANGKWTYNADTIKALKVNSAGYADSAGSAGSVAWGKVTGKPTIFTANGTTGAVDLNNIKTNGSYYVAVGAVNAPGQYGEMLCMSNIDTHAQIYISHAAGPMMFRGACNAGGWYNWRTIIDSGTIGSQSVNYANSAGSANSVAWGNVSGKPTFATVATSGSYNDLSNKPTIPTNTNQLTNGAGFITGITKAMVTKALGYTPPSSDTNTWRPIYNGVDSTATDTSASANAVKTAYDKAVSAYNLANGKTSNTGTVTSVATGTGLTGGTITSTGTISINTTYQGYITNGNNAWASHTKLAANKINAIPVTHKVVTCPISAAGSFAISGTMTAGQVIHVIVQNTTTSAKTVTIPNSGSYHSFSGTSLSVPASKYAEINVVYNGEKMFIRTAY